MGTAVCLFTDSLAPSGVGEHMLLLAEALRGDHSMSLVCPPSPSGLRLLERARGLGLATAELAARGGREAGERLGVFLRDQRVDLFHCHAGVMPEGHEGVRAARAAGVASVLRTEHLPEPTTVLRLEELPDLVHSPYHHPDRRRSDDELREIVAAYRRDYLGVVALVDRVVCVSGAVRDSYVEVGVEPAKLRVVRNGIRPVRPTRSAEETRELLGVKRAGPIVLTVGRMIDLKGHLFALNAVGEVVRRRPDALFVWVGGGPMEEELRARVAARGLGEHVRFAGARSDVPDIMAASDLFLLSSLLEGLPLVVLEAMAAGLPVVATRVPGTCETVRDGVTGRLVERGRLDGSGDADALAGAVLEVLEQPERAAAWGSAGREVVEREFTVARMARETAAVYDELLTRR